MQVIFDSIENVKAKPHHVRRQVAFTIAAGVAGIIGLVWLAGSLAMGSFAIQPGSFADAGLSQDGSPVVSSSQVAGVAAAGARDESTDTIVVVDAPKAPLKTAEQTVIPF